mgnify:CR=1 FL=1
MDTAVGDLAKVVDGRRLSAKRLQAVPRRKDGRTSPVRNWSGKFGMDERMTTMRLLLGVLVIAVLVVGCPEERIVVQ